MIILHTYVKILHKIGIYTRFIHGFHGLFSITCQSFLCKGTAVKAFNSLYKRYLNHSINIFYIAYLAAWKSRGREAKIKMGRTFVWCIIVHLFGLFSMSSHKALEYRQMACSGIRSRGIPKKFFPAAPKMRHILITKTLGGI